MRSSVMCSFRYSSKSVSFTVINQEAGEKMDFWNNGIE